MDHHDARVSRGEDDAGVMEDGSRGVSGNRE
jgi:hypothetical protein